MVTRWVFPVIAAQFGKELYRKHIIAAFEALSAFDFNEHFFAFDVFRL
jgi:hypothetical protein